MRQRKRPEKAEALVTAAEVSEIKGHTRSSRAAVKPAARLASRAAIDQAVEDAFSAGPTSSAGEAARDTEPMQAEPPTETASTSSVTRPMQIAEIRELGDPTQPMDVVVLPADAAAARANIAALTPPPAPTVDADGATQLPPQDGSQSARARISTPSLESAALRSRAFTQPGFPWVSAGDKTSPGIGPDGLPRLAEFHARAAALAAAEPAPAVPSVESSMVPAAEPTSFGDTPAEGFDIHMETDVLGAEDDLSAARAARAALEASRAAMTQPMTVVPPPPPAAAIQNHRSPATARKARTLAREETAWWSDYFGDAHLHTLAYLTADITQREVDALEVRLQVPPGGELLDLACGYGRHALELASRGYQVTGVDSTMNYLVRGADEAQRRNLSIQFIHSDMRQLDFRDRFDGAFCIGNSLGYFEEEGNRRVVESLAAAVKPGGRILVEVLNRDYVVHDLPARVWSEGIGCMILDEVDLLYARSRAKITRSIVFDDGRQHISEISIRLWSLHELEALFMDAGLRIIESSGDLAARGQFLGPYSRSIWLLTEKPE